jgi:hypothetical protein
MTEQHDIDELDPALASLLKDYGEASAPRPATGFYKQALARASTEAGATGHGRWWGALGGAVAAAALLWVVSTVFFRPPEPMDAAVPSVTMSVEMPQTINLVFSSATPLDNATMTVSLPDGIEIRGFAGQHEITWLTSLKEGRNVLPLTLVATTPAGGELLARLQHENNGKTFRLKVSVI